MDLVDCMFETETMMLDACLTPWLATLQRKPESDTHKETKTSLEPIEDRGEKPNNPKPEACKREQKEPVETKLSDTTSTLETPKLNDEVMEPEVKCTERKTA